MATPVIDIVGVGPHSANVLMAHGYKSAEHVVKATVEELADVPGFGPARAKNVLTAARELLKTGATEPTETKKKNTKKDKAKKKTKKADKKKSKPASKANAEKGKKTGKKTGKKKKKGEKDKKKKSKKKKK